MVLNYIGSKKGLLHIIESIVFNKCENTTKNNLIFGDLLAGSGVVGKHFANKFSNFKVISNDAEYYSYIINYALLISVYNDKLKNIINELNDMEINVVDGLIYNNYSKDRMYFFENNAKKADTIRVKINQLRDNNIINISEYNFLVASLLESLDKVANTTSVYGAFLKEFKKTALTPLHITPIHLIKKHDKNHEVYKEDLNDISNYNIKYDIVYLDPPYNERQYASNYHVLNYIAIYEDIDIYGKTGLIRNYFKSKFCQKSNVQDEFSNIVSNLKTRYVIISYNNEGLIDKDTIIGLLKPYGNIILYKCLHKKYKSQRGQPDNFVEERLYLLDKKGTPMKENDPIVENSIHF